MLTAGPDLGPLSRFQSPQPGARSRGAFSPGAKGVGGGRDGDHAS